MIKHLTYIALFILVLVGASLQAQQVQQFTQYQFAGLSFNPAFAGADGYYNVTAIHRTQWTGITDAPRTYMMSLDAPGKSGKMGYGGTLFTDVAGPTRRVGFHGTYAYQFQVSSETKVSLGLAFGLTQFSIDGSQITLRETGDRALTSGMQSELKPDAGFGALWYSKKFYLGVSATQILNNKLDLFPGDMDGRMAVHYFATAAYKFDLNEDFQAEPSVLVKFVSPLPVQADFSGRVIYKGTFWLGGSYRTGDAAAAMAGYQILDYLSLGYSMDFATSDIRNYSDGSHEIFVRIRFAGKNNLTAVNTVE